jgi:DNA-binding NarL/FixJ family response regulator
MGAPSWRRGILDSPKPITVVVSRFDDLLQGGLRELLGRDDGIETLAEGVEQRRMSVVLSGHRPDVAVLDAQGLDRLSEVRELSRRHPQTKLVLLTDAPSTADCAQVLAFGASACLDTATQSRDVLSAIHLASRGMRLTPDAPSGAHDRYSEPAGLLTAKEAAVLPLLRGGDSNAQIALSLQIGVETVRTHTRNIYKKLGVSSRRELLAAPRPADQPPEPIHTGRPRAIGKRSRGHDTLPR